MTPDDIPGAFGPRVRWTDDRLDDKFQMLADEMRAIRDLPMKLAELVVEMREVKVDTHACFESVRETRALIETHREEQRRERTSTVRWTIGSIFTAAGLVIAAGGLLADRV